MLDRAFMQQRLLPMDRIGQPRVFRLDFGETADVGAIGRTHEMRQHVNVAENLSRQRLAGQRMRQRGPVGAGNVPLRPSLVPQAANVVRGGRLVELPHDGGVAGFQRLVQDPGGGAMPGGERDTPLMDLVIGITILRLAGRLGDDPAQLGRTKTRADDRAMDGFRQIPQFASRRGGLKRPRRGQAQWLMVTLGQRPEGAGKNAGHLNHAASPMMFHNIQSNILKFGKPRRVESLDGTTKCRAARAGVLTRCDIQPRAKAPGMAFHRAAPVRNRRNRGDTPVQNAAFSGAGA